MPQPGTICQNPSLGLVAHQIDENKRLQNNIKLGPIVFLNMWNVSEITSR